MKKNNLTVHMIVKNEEQWVWYGIMSVIDHVDKIIIFDTGSTDKTVDIIKTIKSNKIFFKEKGTVNSSQLVDLRNEQIKLTQTTWFLTLDGDEVWSEKAIKEVINKIHTSDNKIMALVSPTIVPVGDLFHYQPKSAGKYKIANKTGHYNIRVYKIDTDYKWQGVYPWEAYVDRKNLPIQKTVNKIEFLTNSYWHLTHLKRSNIDIHSKRKLEIGYKEKKSLPEVFYLKHPLIVPNPWIGFNIMEKIIASIITPFLNLKRIILK